VNTPFKIFAKVQFLKLIGHVMYYFQIKFINLYKVILIFKDPPFLIYLKFHFCVVNLNDTHPIVVIH